MLLSEHFTGIESELALVEIDGADHWRTHSLATLQRAVSLARQAATNLERKGQGFEYSVDFSLDAVTADNAQRGGCVFGSDGEPVEPCACGWSDCTECECGT